MYREGIDVSLWQGDIAGHLPGKSLVIVKVSQNGFLDPKSEQHFDEARRARVEYLGGYHWLGLTPDAVSQARLYLRHVPTDVDFHALDVEGPNLKYHKPEFLSKGREFISAIHDSDDRPVLLYSSRGTWPGNLGQDGNWVADYGGDPFRLSLLLQPWQPRIPWVIWQYTSKPLDTNRYKPDELAALCHGALHVPTPVPTGGTKVKFIQISSADADKLPSLALPAGTKIEDFEGTSWATLGGPTKLHVVPGLVDGHTNRQAVVVNTGRFYADRLHRQTIQVAVLP